MDDPLICLVGMCSFFYGRTVLLFRFSRDKIGWFDLHGFTYQLFKQKKRWMLRFFCSPYKDCWWPINII